MGLRNFKPATPGTRFRSVNDFSEELTTDEPYKGLTHGQVGSGGRNNQGRITVRFRGGGHKQRYRVVDFKRDKDGVPAVVETIEYDPNRGCRIALVCYLDGERRYILAPLALKKGQKIMSGEAADIRDGNTLPLSHIPVGTNIHNIEMKHGKGGQLVRGAGAAAQVLAREGEYAQVRLPSGEVRMIGVRCRASIGQLSNMDRMNISIGKAGRKRWMGRMPHQRGVSMNPVDHPLGGGEGKSSGGRHPVSPWGKKTKGLKTRKRKNQSNKYIVRRRSQKGL